MTWRTIKKGRIQTFSEEVFLWDGGLGVAIRTKVKSRPWNNIDPDFTHWMPAGKFNDGDFPAFIPAGAKPAKANFLEKGGDSVIMEDEAGTLFVLHSKTDEVHSV